MDNQDLPVQLRDIKMILDIAMTLLDKYERQHRNLTVEQVRMQHGNSQGEMNAGKQKECPAARRDPNTGGYPQSEE